MKIARGHVLERVVGLALLVPLVCAGAPTTQRCGPTSAAAEGPFYVANAPQASDINPGKSPGQPMRIGGTVYSEDGITPIRDAKIELWHSDASGAYHPNGNGDIARYPRSEINLRGVTRTDAQGRYTFTSIVPGHYDERRRHLHWKVSAPGHRPVTTQSYWLAERGSEREQGDATDRRAEACRWVDFHDQQGVSVGVFDIVLKVGR
jgi:protocatechuate 3,4-dioxygenase beta subunit